ncbi:MAG: diguanylate cyclase domain-containing protein [Azonexus sp.]
MTAKPKVLVADASKVVRASLAKSLSEQFDVREEASGESAWQTLVLDNTIIGVVSGVGLTKLDGLGLLERVRASKLTRLKALPFFLVVSNSFADEARARALGVTDFVAKDASHASLGRLLPILLAQGHPAEAAEAATELPVAPASDAQSEAAEHLGVQTDVGVGDILGRMGDVQGLEGSAGDEDVLGQENPVGEQERLEEGLARCLAGATDGRGVGVLAFGLDRYDDLVSLYGAELVARTVQKFSFMVARKIRPEDVISQLPGGRVVIVAQQTTAKVCIAFANRICKAMAAAQVAVRGQRIDLTFSAGIAVVPEDGVLLAGSELLNLASNRLEEAQQAGGNRIVAGKTQATREVGDWQTFVPQLKHLLATVDPAALRPCLGNVGLQLMPILREIERTMRLGLPIEDLNRRLWDRARAERMG